MAVLYRSIWSLCILMDMHPPILPCPHPSLAHPPPPPPPNPPHPPSSPFCAVQLPVSQIDQSMWDWSREGEDSGQWLSWRPCQVLTKSCMKPIVITALAKQYLGQEGGSYGEKGRWVRERMCPKYLAVNLKAHVHVCIHIVCARIMVVQVWASVWADTVLHTVFDAILLWWLSKNVYIQTREHRSDVRQNNLQIGLTVLSRIQTLSKAEYTNVMIVWHVMHTSLW